MIFFYPFSFSYSLFFILIMGNPLSLLNRILLLFNLVILLSNRTIETSRSEPSEVLICFLNYYWFKMEVKRIIQDANIHTFYRSHEWDIVKRVWNYSHLKYSSCLLKSTSISKCTKTVLFWNQPCLQGLIHDFPLRSRLSPKLSELYFEIKVDFMSTLK